MSRRTDRYQRELARCDRELAAMLSQPVGQPAYLTTLGILDWQGEKRMIEAEMAQAESEGGAAAGGAR